jgi:hypothetical protein
MADGNGYRSEHVGRQDLQGSAVDRIAASTDTNNGVQVDNDKWYSRLIKYRKKLDALHERVFAD